MKNKTDTLQGGHTDVMKELVRKELFLSTPRPLYLFCFLSALLLIPAYPAVVGVGYCFLAVFIACNYQRANRDIEFTAALPVKRSDIVVGKAVLVMAFQLLQLAVAAAAAAAADYLIYPDGNIVGMDPNLAFFGIVLIGYGAFNVVFLPGYFSTGYKAGAPVLFGLAAQRKRQYSLSPPLEARWIRWTQARCIYALRYLFWALRFMLRPFFPA